MDIKQEYYSSESADDAGSDSMGSSSTNNFPTEVFIKQEPFSYSNDDSVLNLVEEIHIKEENAADPLQLDHLKSEIYKKHLTCYVCDFTTIRKAVYNAHLRTHLTEKRFKSIKHPFNCVKKQLKVYTERSPPKLRIKEGKSHTCDYCSVKFSSKQSLIRHLKSNKKVFGCKLCGQKIIRCMVKTHMQGVHFDKAKGAKKLLMAADAERADGNVSLIGLAIPKDPIEKKLDNLPNDADYQVAYLLFEVPSLASSEIRLDLVKE